MRINTLTPLYSEEQIAERVSDIAGQINARYAGGRLVMICVLKGAFMFFSDLARRITVGPAFNFLRVSSYGTGDATSGAVSLSKDVEISLTGKDVLLVEDIVDSGLTLDFLLRRMRAHKPASLRVAALINKTERRRVNVPVDFFGFSLSGGFVVGYGIDYAERFRELPALHTVSFDV